MWNKAIFLDTLLDVLQDGIIFTDQANQIKRINRSALHILFPGKESAKAVDIFEALLLRNNRKLKDNIEQLKQGEILSCHFIETQDSPAKKIEFTFWPVWSDKEDYQGLIIMVYDLINMVPERRNRLFELKDPLTGLKKGVSFYRNLNNNIARFQQNKDLQLTLLILELDHYQGFCDQQPASEVRKILKKIVSNCLSTIRSHDDMFQLGSNEFAIILIDIPTYNAMLVAERLRKSVYEGAYGQLTASIGSVSLKESMNTEQMFELAVVRLEKAKESGGNCCY